MKRYDFEVGEMSDGESYCREVEVYNGEWVKFKDIETASKSIAQQTLPGSEKAPSPKLPSLKDVIDEHHRQHGCFTGIPETEGIVIQQTWSVIQKLGNFG